jgi:hypothetical protein
MATVCLRLDDVHAGTPIHLLRALDERLWTGRPVILGVVPFPAQGCLGPVATQRESGARYRRTLSDETLRTYLETQCHNGNAEIAVHGLTHADHATNVGPAVAELIAPSGRRADMLIDVLRRFREDFGTTTLIPPHNFIDPVLAERCADDGFSVSRALMDDEVAAFGLDPHSPDDRAEAKRRRPYYITRNGLVAYQSAAVSAESVRQVNTTPQALSSSTMDIVRPAGMGVITFHWWDFLRDGGAINEPFLRFASQFLQECEDLGADDFGTLTTLASRTIGPFT